MRPGLFLLLAVLVGCALGAGSAGCGASSPYPIGNGQGNITVGAAERSFLTFIPSSYDATEPTAIVFMFHGGFGTGALVKAVISLDEVAEEENFIVIYPNGLFKTWNAGGCCPPATRFNVNDIGFVEAMLDEFFSSLCIDTDRVYASGISNGGLMSHRVACELPAFAAVAPVAGTLNYVPCNPSHRVSMMGIYGWLDHNMPYHGGLGCGAANTTFASVENSTATWAHVQGCACSSANREECASVYLEELNTTCLSFGPCDEGVSVVECTVYDGGHSFPGANYTPHGQDSCPVESESIGAFPSIRRMWDFFKSHPKPHPCEAAPVVENAVDLSACADTPSGASCPLSCVPGHIPSDPNVTCILGSWAAVTCDAVPSTTMSTATSGGSTTESTAGSTTGSTSTAAGTSSGGTTAVSDSTTSTSAAATAWPIVATAVSMLTAACLIVGRSS